MSCNQPIERLSKEPLNMGILIFVPISSVAGSATLSFSQPLIDGNVFASAAILIGAELFLYIAERLFDLESIPVVDAKNGQTVQMPLSELQEFLRWMANGSDPSKNSNPAMDRTNLLNTDGEVTGTLGDRGFPTPLPHEAPLTVSIYVNTNYSNREYTPYNRFFIPILSFPGLRGALPLLILGLLATIFVRAVVPPESTGSRPHIKPGSWSMMNNPLTFTPNDLLQLLNRFGKNFGPK